MAKPIIPDKPVYWFKGKRQSPAFSDGVEAFRAFLEHAESDMCTPRRVDDQEFAERHAERILSDVAKGNDFRLGYAAAIANYIGILQHSTPVIERWIPLCTEPIYREVNGSYYWEPPARALLFEVDGAAIAISEELDCNRYGRASPNTSTST